MSLRLRLLLFIGLSFTLIWGVVASWMFLDIKNELRAALDNRLAASARMVASLVLQIPTANLQSTDPKTQLTDLVARDGLACEISLLRGEVSAQPMVQSAGSPGLADTATGFGTHVFSGKTWRTYVLVQNGVRVAMADRVDVRDDLLHHIALSAWTPFVFTMFGSLVLLWFDIGRGLAPIERIRTAVAQQNLDDETPLPEIDSPPELNSLVATIRHLLDRVRGTIARERRFSDDAAHELRTPLTAIKTHLQVARLAVTKPQGDVILLQALTNADQGVLRLQGTLDQLLLLARLSGEGEQGPNGYAEMDFAVQQAVKELRGNHDESRNFIIQNIGANINQSVKLAIPQELLVCALRNLLDNAFRYSPVTSSVTLQVERVRNEEIRFSVLDEGPGLSDLEITQATQRFWRRGVRNQNGSGLGLSIVTAIAERYGCKLKLHSRSVGGLEVVFIVPIYSEPTNLVNKAILDETSP